MPPSKAQSKAGSKAGAAGLCFGLRGAERMSEAQVGALTKAGCSDAELKHVEALTKAGCSVVPA
jgi:hypothetical protein